MISFGTTFRQYHSAVRPHADYARRDSNVLAPALGLSDHAVGAVETIKKNYRATGSINGHTYTPKQKAQISKELGNVLSYLDAVATEIGTTLEDIALRHMESLSDAGRN